MVEKRLGKKQKIFVEHYLRCWNATEAARRAEYAHPNTQGPRLLVNVSIKEEIKKRIDETVMSADEAMALLGDQARASLEDIGNVDENGRFGFDFAKAKENGKLHLVKSITPTASGTKVELYSAQRALELIGKAQGVFADKPIEVETKEPDTFSLPADAIAPDFYDVYRHIKKHDFTEFVFKGGRGSTKSSFVSESIIELIVNNPEWHALATRQVKDTLRDSVYSQLVWAINYLGMADKFRCIKSPLEITYIPTGQKIYFRGADDPLKIKSIKPRFGYINILWCEELDQFRGSAAVRSIVQSAIRGGDHSLILKSFNPPRSQNNWVNKELSIPKEKRYIHESNYLNVPVEWLGQTFIDEAEYLKEINPSAYNHEYMGEITGTGGLVFENVKIRKITDEEISQFDRILHGLDWGYFPDPAHYVKMHYDAARLTLYIYGETRKWKTSNRALYDILVENGLLPSDMIIADSAEPKSIADFRTYGASCRGAEKGPESVRYSIKWLQSLRKIVIDNIRTPFAADEFINYEHETNKDGEYISAYPDKDNHAIDGVRYGTNFIWRRRGQ